MKNHKLLHLSYHFSLFLTISLLFKCRFGAWRRGFPRKFASSCQCLLRQASVTALYSEASLLPQLWKAYLDNNPTAQSFHAVLGNSLFFAFNIVNDTDRTDSKPCVWEEVLLTRVPLYVFSRYHEYVKCLHFCTSVSLEWCNSAQHNLPLAFSQIAPPT